MQVQCPSCSKLLRAPDEKAGQIIACPACGGQMQLPVMPAPSAAPAPARAPRRDMVSPPGGPLADGGDTRPCPYCGEPILKVAKKCKHCRTMLAGGGAGRERFAPRGRRRPTTSGDGTTALVLGIIGLIICQPILGPLAIIYGNRARRNPAEATLGTIGMVLGIVAVGIFVLLVLAGVLGRAAE